MASYIDSNLLPGETLVHRARLHWIVYLKYAAPLKLVGAVLGLVFVGGLHGAIIGAFCGILAGFAVGRVVVETSEFGITDMRVLVKVGFVRRHSLEIVLRQVEGIGVDQTILGRILGYGTITVDGTGSTKEAFEAISDPLAFRRQVQALAVRG